MGATHRAKKARLDESGLQRYRGVAMRSRRTSLVLATAVVLAPFARARVAHAEPPKASAPGAHPAATAHATTVTAPAGGGLGAVEVSIDAGAGVLHVRRGAGAVHDVAIPIEKSRIDVAAATLEVLAVGDGRRVVHARVPDFQRKDLAFEAIVSGQSDEPIWAGLTGYTQGSEGDRAGSVVLEYERDAQTKFLIVGETREDTRICGQAVTPLAARGLDPHTMTLRGATLHRLDKKARDAATRIVAQVRAPDAKAPLARVLVATGGSAPNAAALTDGKTETVWSETRPGDGHGEFATMRAPAELPLASLVVTVAPATPSPEGAAPRTFYVATDKKLLQVTMPEDAWRKPGQSYEITLPEAVSTSCVAIVLDEAYAGANAAPEVSLAEVNARSSFDAEGASLDDVAKALSSKRGDEAAALLRRASNDGLAAVVSAYANLDGRGRALAIDVASSAGACDGPAGELLTRGLTDRDVEVKKRALGRIERCGKAASAALTAAVRSDDEKRRTTAAPLLATVSPTAALEPLSEQLGKGAADTRRAVRGAFARAAMAASRDKLLALVGKRDTPAAARIDLLRGLGAKIDELRPDADKAIADLLLASPDMPTRYLLAQPLAQLARAPDATAGELSRLAELARRDPEWAVRARAVELAAGITALAPTVIAAASDPEPRVREAALHALAVAATAAGTGVASQALAKDDWTFVRVAAAEALGAMTPDASTGKALGEALEDPSPKVRWAAVAALGKQRATSLAGQVRDRLDDTKEDPDVRALAAKTLGAMCDRSATDRLTKLAQLSRSPTNDADDRIGLAAIEALGTLHPADLDKRLAPLRDKNVRMPVRRAAERALGEQGGCR
jgi:hypothetical protein